MFAGASFAPLSALRHAGYDSRLSAKADFYTKAKLLYDFGYESDRVRVVQALLLLSYWQDKQDALQNHWYWVALANVVARSIGLHRDPAESMAAEDQGLWRRLGWTCFVRDRIISLGVRQPPTIELRQFHVSMLETADFGISTLSHEILQLFPDCEILHKPEIQVPLAQVYIEKVKLCIVLDGVFTTKYHEVAPRHGVAKENAVVLLDRELEKPENMSSQHSAQLQKWQDELPSVVQCGASPMHALTQGDQVLRLHQSLLHMLYHTVFLLLYSPREVLNAAPSSSVRRCMRLASSSIAHTMEDLQGHDLVRFLPSASVTMIVNAAVTNVYEHNTAQGPHREWCIRRFLDCIWYLRQLQDIHKYAAFGAEFLIRAADKLKLPIRLPTEPHPFEFGVWEHAHNPERFLRADLDDDSNVISETSDSVHDPHQPMPHGPFSGTALAQRFDNPAAQYELGWDEYTMPYPYDSYDMLFSDAFGTTFPAALLDSWVVEHFEPLVNE
ncbi:fungal-specific transcription factor domain-containing protein [Aspergillus novoparasiticus]|uniref:Fungal-specific transcription factor domain-containing protein n=1 Tax=Aspergillus novoparasiticus TaxID=986946 RepID=A0A5N6E715_9EURO|nr:fungal-specific transcription factor domain-containing protein [Aspergillus novoparasiticus]